MIELTALAKQIDLNADSLEMDIKSGRYQPDIDKERERFFKQGFTGVPTILINGRSVAPESFNVKCIEELIGRALEKIK